MNKQAFTRVELLISILAIGALGSIAVSVGADTRDRSERMVCMNNQRLIGRGFNAWAADHGGENPWWTPQRDGGIYPEGSVLPPYHVPGIGTFPAAVAQNAWFQFALAHEELASPAVLVCPSDPGRRRASGFSIAPGGFAHISMQNGAVSYLIGLHAVRELPTEILAGDRNVIAASSASGGCSSGIRTGARVIFSTARGGQPTGWTNGLHVTLGNLLMNDGRVEQMTSADLNAYFNGRPGDGFNSFHFIQP